MSPLTTLLEEINASVFSGDLFYVKEERAALREYAERWLRAIGEHEGDAIDDLGAVDTASQLR